MIINLTGDTHIHTHMDMQRPSHLSPWSAAAVTMMTAASASEKQEMRHVYLALSSCCDEVTVAHCQLQSLLSVRETRGE